MLRIRTWWQALLLGLVLGVIIGALYGTGVSVLPGLSGRVWYATLPTGQAALAGAALGLCYGVASSLAGVVTLAVDARMARDPGSRRGLAVRVAAAVAAAIGVVVAFLLVALVAGLTSRAIDLSDMSLLVLVGVPAVLAALASALVAQFAFHPVLAGRGA